MLGRRIIRIDQAGFSVAREARFESEENLRAAMLAHTEAFSNKDFEGSMYKPLKVRETGPRHGFAGLPNEAVRRIARSLLTGSLVLLVFALADMRVGTAADYPSAGTLLRRSMTVMQHSVHEAHGDGVIRTESCCPKIPAVLRLTGDCVTGSNIYAVRAAAHGAMSFDGKSIVAVDFHDILRSTHRPASIGAWTRSPATHNSWQRATIRTLLTRQTDLISYLCPSVLLSQFTQHFPTHLVNLGSVTVQGASAWHLQDRLAVTRGGMKGTVLQSDFYLARSSLFWLRYESIYRDNVVNQHVVADYSRLNVPITIVAPSIGSSVP